MQIEKNKLIGVWQLLSAEFGSEGEEALYLWGKFPTGYLFYTENGYMTATLTQALRPALSTQDLLNASEKELASAARDYLSYVGTYSISGETILHQIKTCIFSNWTGGEHTRFVDELTEETLVLRCPPMLIAGKERTGYLRWKKVAAAPRDSTEYLLMA